MGIFSSVGGALGGILGGSGDGGFEDSIAAARDFQEATKLDFDLTSPTGTASVHDGAFSTTLNPQLQALMGGFGGQAGAFQQQLAGMNLGDFARQQAGLMGNVLAPQRELAQEGLFQDLNTKGLLGFSQGGANPYARAQQMAFADQDRRIAADALRMGQTERGLLSNLAGQSTQQALGIGDAANRLLAIGGQLGGVASQAAATGGMPLLDAQMMQAAAEAERGGNIFGSLGSLIGGGLDLAMGDPTGIMGMFGSFGGGSVVPAGAFGGSAMGGINPLEFMP